MGALVPLLFALLGVHAAAAQEFPTRPLKIVVPNAPASSGDIVARLLAPPLAGRLGQPVVVENRSGASTMIGGEAVAKSAPDGYTLLMGLSTLAINPALFKHVPYDALADFAPITQAMTLPGVLVVHPSLPAASIGELIALARARPGAITFASGGNGSYSDLSMELFTGLAGVQMLHVPYKSSAAAVTDLLGGQVSVMVSNILSAIPHVRSGKLRALGVTTAARAASAPSVPAISEAGLPGYESVQWAGLLAPAHTPRPVVGRLYKEAAEVLRSSTVKERLAADGAEPVGSSPEEFTAYLRTETIKWAKVVKAANIQPE